MTEDEKYSEMGRLLCERADLKQTLNCIHSKLDRAIKAFRAAADALEVKRRWEPAKDAKGGLIVPVDIVKEEIPVLPPSDDFERWLSEKISTEEKIDGINQRLPD